MKKLLFSAVFFALGWTVKAQNTCCQTVFASNDGNMAVFVEDDNFRSMHPSPVAYVHESMVGGQMISFPTPDQKQASGYFVAAKKKSDKWLFVYQEWWGLNDHIKKQADIFYTDLGEDVNVLALDMYDGRVTTTPSEAGQLMQSAQELRLEAIMKGAMAYAGPKAKFASVGWCFGGGLSLKSAILGGKQTVGSVMYYGMPVQDVEKLKTLQTDVLGLFATEQWISKVVIEEFANNMKAANKKLTYKIFDAAHAFANPSNPKFDEAAAKEAYDMAITYLRKKLK